MSDPRVDRLTDSERRARSTRRALAKQHHPDLGGDSEEFVRVMRAVEDRSEVAEAPVTFVSRARPARALRSTSKIVVAALQRRLPRSFPGSRRYGHL